MSTPGNAPARYEGDRSPDRTVEPSAIATARASAVYAVGDVLKQLVHHSTGFPSENTADAAHNAIDGFVRSFVSDRELPAILTGDERAPKEDVTQRRPSGQASFSQPVSPGLDYAQLARAILAEQRRIEARQSESPAPGTPLTGYDQLGEQDSS